MGDGYLARVIRVLEAFDSELSAMTVGAIASATGIPLPSAYRIVSELADMGLLLRDVDGRIRLGARLWELANRGSPLNDLREAAHGDLIALHRELGCHVNLAVLREGSVLVVDRILADTVLPNRSMTASRMSALRSSLGRAQLAFAPAAQVRLAVAIDLASGVPDARGGDDGDVAFREAEAAMARELARVRRLGYAVQRALQDESTMGVSAPIRAGRGEAVAAIGVVLPIETTARTEQAVAEQLRAAAGRIVAAQG